MNACTRGRSAACTSWARTPRCRPTSSTRARRCPSSRCSCRHLLTETGGRDVITGIGGSGEDRHVHQYRSWPAQLAARRWRCRCARRDLDIIIARRASWGSTGITRTHATCSRCAYDASTAGITGRLERESAVTYPCEKGRRSPARRFIDDFPTRGRAKLVAAQIIPAAETPDNGIRTSSSRRQLEHGTPAA